MIISHRKRFIYFVTPKCASTTIRLTVSPYTDIGYPIVNTLPHHIPIAEFMEGGYADLAEEYFKFTFVRNPYDRLYSSFIEERLASDYFSGFSKEKQKILNSLGDDYNRYILEYVSKERFSDRRDWVCFFPMHKFAYYDNHQFVDWYGRVENLEEDYLELSRLIGIDVKLFRNSNVRVKPSNKLKYLDKYVRSVVEKVNELYKEDFDYFGYEMLNPDDFPESMLDR